MAEDEVIDRLRERRAELVQGFILPLEGIADAFSEPGFPGPSVAHPEGEPGVQGAETALEEAVVESPPHEFVATHAWTEPVAVTQAELLSADLRHIRLYAALHPEFLEIGVGPDVVVPLKEIHFHAGVHQVLQGGENARIALGDHVPVFIPEVPDVAEEVQGLRLGRRNSAEELHETRFPAGRVGNGEAQVDVGDEVCESSRQG